MHIGRTLSFMKRIKSITPLVPHIDKFRRIWMFPRNIRRIYPWKISQILVLLNQHVKYDQWSGNQALQDSFCKALERSGLKNAGVQYDPNSGGPRTYLAQLKGLGLIFERSDRSIYFTIAGENLLKGHPPMPILQETLLRHQYPSVYGNLQNVRMNPNIKVKPFLFVLELLNHPDVRYLTNKELIIPTIYGHNRRCKELCVEKILKIRAGKELNKIIEDDLDLYLPRSRKADRVSVLENIGDIANTCKNYLQACCLINVESFTGKQKISFNQDMKEVYEKALQGTEHFISVPDGEEAFQRSYGACDRAKDTRRLDDTAADLISVDASIILSQFYQLCGEKVISKIPEDFIDEMYMGFGFPKEQIRDVIEPYIDGALDFFESTFLALSTGGKSTAISFEKSICNLLQNKLHFQAEHTGQLKDRNKQGGFADVFIIALDNKHCAVIDAKATSSYNLPSNDYRAMTYDYIPNYSLLTRGKPLMLEFGSFISGGFSTDFSPVLKNIKKETGIDCSAVRAKDLLDLSKKNPLKKDQKKIREIFAQSKIITSEDFMDT